MKKILSTLLFLAYSVSAFAATKLIPSSEWLVPASELIFLGTLTELKQLRGTTDIPTPDNSKTISASVRVQIAKASVTNPLLGSPPSEPIIVNIDLAGIHNLTLDEPYLFFLSSFEGRHSVFQIVEALKVRDGVVPWRSSSSAIHIEPTPIDLVVEEIANRISLRNAQQGAAANP